MPIHSLAALATRDSYPVICLIQAIAQNVKYDQNEEKSTKIVCNLWK